MTQQEALEKQIEIEDYNVDENGCQIDYFVHQLNGETKEMHFICNEWQFRGIMQDVLGYDLARKNYFWIHYPEPHPDEPTMAKTSIEVYYKNIMRSGSLSFSFDDMKKIAVWHELKKLNK